MRSLIFSLAIAGTMAAGPAQAAFLTHYNINLAANANSVDGIIMYEDNVQIWPQFALAGSSVFNSVIETPAPRQTGVMIGLSFDNTPDYVHFADEIPAEPAHIVLFVSKSAADAFAGKTWDQLFPLYNEDDMIAAVEKYGIIGDQSTDTFLDTDWVIKTELVNSFAASLQVGLTLDDHGVSPWYLIPGATQTPTDMGIVEFSTGTEIGTASAFQTDTTPAPEPASFLLIGGGGVVLLWKRRRSGITIQ